MFQELRFGLHILARNPSVAAWATIVLALGVRTQIFNDLVGALAGQLGAAEPRILADRHYGVNA